MPRNSRIVQEVIAVAFQRLRDLRDDKELNQEDIGKLLSLHREVYGRYERGDTEIPVWAVIKLAEYYGVSTDYILGLTDDPRPYKRIRKK